MTPTIVFVVLLAAVALWILHRAHRQERTGAAAHALARRVDLALPDDVEPAVTRRLARRERAGGWLSLVAVLLVGVWAWLTPAQAPVAGPFVVYFAFFAGHAVGYGVVAWREAARPVPAEGPRIARTATPTQGDYVARHERWSGWVLAGAALAVALGLPAVEAAGVDLGELPWALLVATAVLPSLVMVSYELGAVRMLRRRQVAATALELAWDDALRARTLRDMLTAALVVGFGLPLALLGVVGERLDGGWPANLGVGIVNGAFLLLLGTGLVMAVVSVALRPQRHFRARLWPRPVAAQGVA